MLTAYQGGDLEELQTLSLLLSEQENLPEPSTMEQLADDIEKLKEKIEKMLENLAKMQEQFPFNFRDKLNDERWVTAQQEAVEKQIKEMERHRQTYASVLAELSGGGETFNVH